MSSMAAVVVMTVVLLALIVIRVPVAFSLMTSGAVGLLLVEGFSTTGSVLGRLPFTVPSQFSFVIIPMFITMGIFARQGRMADHSYRLASVLTRRFPGGLAASSVLACAAFAAISGSSIATVLTVGKIAVGEMLRYGYDIRLALGSVAAAGTLGVLIPPSIILVFYGILTGESIGFLLIAGIVPGFLSGLLYIGFIGVTGYRKPHLVGRSVASLLAEEGREEQATSPVVAASETAASDWQAVRLSTAARQTYPGVLQASVLFLIVVGGIYSGVFTATEASAVGAAAALLIVFLDRKGGQAGVWTRFRSGIEDTVAVTSMAFALLVGAALFTFVVVAAGIPRSFASWLTDLPLPGPLIVALILLSFVPLGMILDPLSILLIMVPLVYPAVVDLGYDGVWFGILVVKMGEFGLITPPVGINAFVVAGTADEATVEDAFKGIMWFLPIDLLTVSIIFVFPSLVLWLPTLTGT